MGKSATSFELILALIKLDTWNTEEIKKLGFKPQTIRNYRRKLKQAQLDLDNRLKK